MAKARRIKHEHGRIIIGFIYWGRPIGQDHIARTTNGLFHHRVRFYSTKEVKEPLLWTGSVAMGVFQTIFRDPREMTAQDPGHREVRQGGAHDDVNQYRLRRQRLAHRPKIAVP